MKICNTVTLILATLALLACGPENKPQTRLFETERNALDKAKALDSTLQQQSQQQQQELEKQTQ